MASSPNENQYNALPSTLPPSVSNKRIFWCSVGLTIIAALMLPVQLGKKYKTEISITATGVRDENAKGVEVWVSETSGPGIVASATAEGWEKRGQSQVSYQFQPATLKWSGAIVPAYRLYFMRHPNSGRMILSINGNEKEFVLYSDKEQIPLEIIPFDLMKDPQTTYSDGLISTLLNVLGLFLFVYILFLILIRREHIQTNPIRLPVSSLALLALPSLITYTMVLLALWPGQMSPDSVSHWVESETANFSDAHPAMLSIMMRLVTRVWHSPTVIPVIQIITLTVVTVLIIAKFREFGVPIFFCYTGAIAFPLFPANFMMVTTVWKDVPYTIALLYIFWLFISLIQTQGVVARKLSWRLGFFAASSILIFTRHNGILVGLGLPFLCGIFYWKVAGRFFVVLAFSLIAAILSVKLILFPILKVSPLPKYYQPMSAIHVLAANVANGASFTKDEVRLMESVYPLERWKDLYHCQTYVFLLFGDGKGTPSYDSLANHSSEFIFLALKKIGENPGIYLHHLSCATSMLWRIFPFQGEGLHTNPLGVADTPLARQYGITTAPKLPRLHKLLEWISNWTKQYDRIWYFWRPGIWLFLSVIASFGLALSNRDARIFLLLAPSILNTMSLAPIMASPDFRYQWVVVATGLFLFPLALLRKTTLVFDTNNNPVDSISFVSEQLYPDLPSDLTGEVNLNLPDQFDKKIIAVVIPCYRVREHVLQLLNRLGPECSLIYCIDDKCPENSGEYIQQHTNDPRVRVIFHKFNQGVGGAVLSGYLAAIKEGATVIVKLDGDGQMDPALLPAFVAPILEGSADYTKGNRFFYIEGLRGMPPLRLFGNAVLSFLTKLSSGYWTTFDPTNGYTAISASVARLLPFGKIERRYFFESDMLFRLNVLRAKVVDIPMAAVYRGEKSNLVISSVAGEFIWKHTRNFVKRMGYNYFLRDFSIASVELLLGVPLVAFGFLFGVHAWIISLDTGVVTTAGTVMLSVLPSILGVQFLLSFVGHDIQRTPSEPIQRLLLRLPNFRKV